MAKKLVLCFLLSFSLILSLSSSQQLFKCIFSISEPHVTGSWISGRKLLGGRVYPAVLLSSKYTDKMERFEAKAGSESDHESREDEEEGKGMVYTSDYHRVKTHSSPLPKHPKP